MNTGSEVSTDLNPEDSLSSAALAIELERPRMPFSYLRPF